MSNSTGSFDDYIEDYDRKAYGAGSHKGTDRFSALDVRKMFDERGSLSKSDAAQKVLDYAEQAGSQGAKMGGGTEDALDKLRGYLGESDSDSADNDEPYVESQRLKEAKERANSWGNRFDENGNDSWSTSSTASTNGDAKKFNNQSDNTSHYLDNYKLNLRDNNLQRKNQASSNLM